MIRQEYECISFGKKNHDVYLGGLFSTLNCICLHTALRIQKNSTNTKNIEDRLFKDLDNEYGRNLSDDDLCRCLFACIQAFANSGTGIQPLYDDYVICYRRSLDMDYIHGEAKKLKVDDFVVQWQCISEACLPILIK